MATHFIILAWSIQGQRSLVGYSSQDQKELDMIEATQHAHTFILFLESRVQSLIELVVSVRHYKSQPKVKIHADLYYFYLSKSDYKNTFKIFKMDYKNLFDLSLMWLNSFIFSYSPSVSSNFHSFGQKYHCLMLLCFYTKCFPLYTHHCPSHLFHLANSSTSFYDLFRSPSLQSLP